MHHQEFEPLEALRSTIKCFWYNQRRIAHDSSSFEVQPDGYAEIIFFFGKIHSRSNTGELQALASPFMMGLLNQPAPFFTDGPLDIIGIRCYPWTVFALLGLRSDTAGTGILEHPIAHLQAELASWMPEGKVREAVDVLERYCLDANSNAQLESVLSKAGVAMTAAKGTLPVSQVAASAHVTVRTLERRFKQSSGHTVKDVSALMRFERVRNHLWLYPHANLAPLAHDLGYADQSHLSREFKRFSGATPAAFARKAKQDKQFLNGDFVAFVQAGG